jgi:hypothetical protein
LIAAGKSSDKRVGRLQRALAKEAELSGYAAPAEGGVLKFYARGG